MKHKVSELEGPTLARAVALVNGWRVYRDGPNPEGEWICEEPNGAVHSFGEHGYRPDVRWEHGGPIIERKRIGVAHFQTQWRACAWDNPTTRAQAFDLAGPTSLIAAMRAIVASQLGEEVDLPA